ncbi:P-loop containing nucleoside triphosphate hydrolase protein [Rozella allomycis CSF55]|uniref:Thymidylate kinase n=1 Tax=Rozella allomycis (strain CSF55) TaxID=988480 RepID=A0A4P9YI48_ROZAC|nr:P-loop containing nucleoside triphosphate hydrolase protein [Rozella allomycis CSF55]
MSQEKRKRGILIVFEGCDRSGKSTQSKLLYEFLKERTSVELLRFPDRTTDIGKVINQYLTSSNNLNDQCIHLLFSANRWELKEKIVQLLNSGTSVILDRYVYSGIAFSAAKGLDLEWCRACDKGLPKPDVLYFFQLELEQASKRGNFGQERYETLEKFNMPGKESLL